MTRMNRLDTLFLDIPSDVSQMVYEITAVSCFTRCIELYSIIRIEQCDESVYFLFGSFMDNLLLFPSFHIGSCYIRFRIQPCLILKSQNYLFLKEHEIPSCTCLPFLSSLRNHYPFPIQALAVCTLYQGHE